MVKRFSLLFLFTTLLLPVTKGVNEYPINKGVLELGVSNVLEKNAIKLAGNWEFYWNQLLEPDDFKNKGSNLNPAYIQVPKSWTSLKVNGNKLPSMGYATYRLIVHKKADSEKTVYGLKVSTIFSNYKLWVNGKLIGNVGEVGKTKSTSKPGFIYKDIPFILDPAEGSTENIEIIIQVSNFYHQRCGLHFPIYLSSYKNLIADTRKMDILNLIIIGIILVIGINHLTLYFFRKQDRSNLYFGIICMVMILRNLSTGDRIISYIFPNIGWEFLLKIDNFSGFGTIPLFALFIYILFQNEFPKILRNIYLYIGAAITIFVFATPAVVYGKLRTFYELYVLFGGLYLTFGILLIATLRKRPYALPTFLGMFLLYSTAINDVLSSMGIIQTAYLAPYGLVAFMLIQSITINNKSASAINENEKLSDQLQHEKENLELKIEERTRELKSQHDELLKHQEKEKLQSWVNTGVASINEVLSRNKENFSQLCKNVLVAMIKYLDAKLGALYILNTDNSDTPYLELVSDFGLSKEHKSNNLMIPTNSGLIGASFSNNEIQHLTDIPENYFKINSGLGDSSPKSLLILPLCFDEKVYGIIELASFRELSSIDLEFASKAAINIASNLNTVKMNDRNLFLIQQFKEQSEMMQEKEERMRQNLEELEYIREQYESLKKGRIIDN